MVVFCVGFHTMKGGLELSVAVASQALWMAGGEGFAFNFLFGKTKLLPSGGGKEESRLPRNLRGRSRGRVPTGGGIHEMGTRGGVPASVP